MQRSFDTVIIGGGVIGSAVAYFLTAHPDFDGTVAVVERDTGYADTSSARSVSGVRQQFTNETNVLMSRFAAAFLREAEDLLTVDGDRPLIPFVEQGYLMLASDAGTDILQRSVTLQQSCGAGTELLDPGGLKARFPWLSTDGIAAGAFGTRDEGWTDAWSLMNAFRKKAASRGAIVVNDTVTGLEMSGRRVVGVRLAGGETLACGHAVNAAGPDAAGIAAMTGVDLPVERRKRYVYVFDCRDDFVSEIGKGPLTVDPSGIYFRPEGGQFLCGLSPRAGEEPAIGDYDVDYDFFETRIWEGLAQRVPAFEAIRVVNAWAGYYAYNTLDQNALLGWHPDVDSLLFANGFSGHGLQQAPAVGRGIAELIVDGSYRSLDLSPLGIDRIVSGDARPEANVV